MTDEELLALPYRPNVGVMLVNSAGNAFVGRRIDTQSDAWQMPQGGIDKGEDAQEAAFRELTEETGILPAHATIIAVSQGWLKYDFPREVAAKLWLRRSGAPRFRGQKQRWFLMRFTGQDADVNIATVHPEFSDWAWLATDKLVENIVPFKRDIYQQVLQQFSPYLAGA